MKIFANKNIFKKIVIIFIVIMAVSFIVPKVVSASLGGELMTPIMSLFVGIADGINTLIQKFFLHQDTTILVVSEGIELWKVALGIIAGVGLIALGIICPITQIAWGAIALGTALTATVTITAINGRFYKN